MSTLPASPKNEFPSGSCSLRLVWVGYRDWLHEQANGPAPAEAPAPMQGPKPAALWWAVLVIPAFILFLAVVVPLLAPTLVAGMSLAGPAVVANVCKSMSVMVGLAVLPGVPYLLARRAYRFIKMCCRRGLALEAGHRAPVRPR